MEEIILALKNMNCLIPWFLSEKTALLLDHPQSDKKHVMPLFTDWVSLKEQFPEENIDAGATHFNKLKEFCGKHLPHYAKKLDFVINPGTANLFIPYEKLEEIINA